MKHALVDNHIYQRPYESGESNCLIEQTSCFFFDYCIDVNVNWLLLQMICMNLDPKY